MIPFADPWARLVVRTVYYLVILAGVLLLHSRFAFATPAFVYQGF